MRQLDLLPPEPPDPLDKGLIAYCRRHGIPAVLPDTIEAGDACGANCGPMALAAVLDLPTVEAARLLVQPFRGFMSPTDMQRALDRTGVRHTDVDKVGLLGLVRIQWVGPWCGPGIDPRAAYRYTHWIGMRRIPATTSPDPRERLRAAERRAADAASAAMFGERPELEMMSMVYDATPNRWIPMSEWSRWCPSLYPKRATGWRMATAIEVVSPRR